MATKALHLSGYIDIPQIEDALGELSKSEEDALVIDLSKATYLDVTAMQYLIALIRKRQTSGFESSMLLPSGSEGLSVRNAMRRWGMAKAIGDACESLKFSDLVEPSELKYFRGRGGDKQKGYEGIVDTYETPDGRITARINAHRFYGFKTWLANQYRDPHRLVREATNSWPTQAVKSVLDIRLNIDDEQASGLFSRGDADFIARINPSDYARGRIFYEAISNAVRHPGAKVIQTVSHMSPNDDFFTFTFWDDGASMQETLIAAVNSEAGYQAEVKSGIEKNYEVTIREGDSNEILLLNNNHKLGRTSKAWEYFLATIFPGTTRDPKGRDYTNVKQDDGHLALPGMGLYVLIEAATNVLNGQVSFRSADWFMNVKASTEDRTAKVSIKSKKHVPSFLGNMVTVRLPLKK
ncbi:MAG: hypothetical protein ACE37D_21285 [Pseudomonadales bacterium]